MGRLCLSEKLPENYESEKLWQTINQRLIETQAGKNKINCSG